MVETRETTTYAPNEAALVDNIVINGEALYLGLSVYDAISEGVEFDDDFDLKSIAMPEFYKTFECKFNNVPVYIAVANNGNTVVAAPGTATGTQTADNTQGTLTLDSSNKWIVLDKTDEDDIVKFGHLVNSTPYFEGTYRANTNGVEKNIIETEGQKPKFGEPFNILNVSVDRAGHVIDFGINTVTIPKGKYETNIPNTDSSSLIVGMELNESTGEITTTSATTKTLKLADYSLPTSVDNNGILTSGQSINDAFGRLEYRINEEINKRKAAFDLLYYGEDGPEGKTISKAFDTIKKIADWLDNDAATGDTGVEELFNKIATNSRVIEDEIDRATKAENNNTDLINNEISRAQTEEEKINTRINDLVGDTKVSVQIDNKISEYNETFSDTAFINSEYFATAEQGALAVSAIQPGSEFNYGEQQETIQGLMDIVKAQAETIDDLILRIEALEKKETIE